MDEEGGDSYSRTPAWRYVGRAAQTQLEQRHFEPGATIPFDKMDVFPAWSGLFMMRDSVRVALVIKRVCEQAKFAQRRLTADEADAVSQHANTTARTIMYAPPVAWGLAAWATWSGAAKFRFPLFTPKMRMMSPHAFPTRRFPMFRGRAAVGLWHILRFSCYLPPIYLGTLMFFTSVMNARFSSRLTGDPRLTGLIEDIKRNSRTAAAMKMTNRVPGAYPPGGPNAQVQEARYGADTPFPEKPKNFSEQQASPVQQQQYQQPSQPPTYGQPSPPTQNAQYGASVGSSSSAPPTVGSWGPASNDGQSGNSPSQNWADTPSSSYDDDDDDMSPVAPASRREEARSGSAWDKLRQQSKPGAGHSSWERLRQQGGGGGGGGGGSSGGSGRGGDYGGGESQQQMSDRERAQREFDDMVDSTRNDGSGR